MKLNIHYFLKRLVILKYYSRTSWFLFRRNGGLIASYYGKRVVGEPVFKLILGRLRVEWY